MKPFDYKIIASAQNYYEQLGFKYIHVPWHASREAMAITCPKNVILDKDEYLVASGEQSFLQMILDWNLSIGKSFCITPCYRPTDKIDDLHCHEFIKLELIDYFGWVREDELMLQSYNFFIERASDFFGQYLRCEVVETKDEERQCSTWKSCDIISNGIELGSYGIRVHEKVGWWVYGTGVALPRLSDVMEINDRKGI